jgi:hypothetical protein
MQTPIGAPMVVAVDDALKLFTLSPGPASVSSVTTSLLQVRHHTGTPAQTPVATFIIIMTIPNNTIRLDIVLSFRGLVVHRL